MASHPTSRIDATAGAMPMLRDWKTELRCAVSTYDAATLVRLMSDPRAEVRLAALKQACPCRVRDDFDALWNRVFEMVTDADAGVRAQVLHTVCDGSPAHLESRVADALEAFNRDTDPGIRRTAHKVLATYRRTGKWNIL